MPVSQQIKQAFSAGTTIVTSNVRAARWLRLEYAQEQRAAGRRAWPTPPILDWDTWLVGIWQRIALDKADLPLLLTSPQQRRVWTRMLKADSEQLVSASGMAAMAESAYQLLSRYDAQGERKRIWGRSDAESFRRWAADFDVECSRMGWMPRADLEHRISNLLALAELPPVLLLVGFERITPAQERLLGALKGKAVIITIAGRGEPAPAHFVRASGQRQEIEACAFWVRERLLENPETRIGVLVPDLIAVRSELERVFRRVLMPQAEGVFSAEAMPFEFSLGLPLADVPVIKAALLLLRWLRAPLAEEELTWLLLSGYLTADQADIVRLAKADVKRRDSGSLSPEISLPEFLQSDRTSGGASSMTRLADLLRAAEANHLNEERLPSRWADLVQLLLDGAGWPGSMTRDTLHFQALRRWERALDEIALLNFDGRRMSYGEFLTLLAAHAQEVIFAPESEGAPVQIMGAAEASGQQFDALWFLSADDESWPSRGRSHPLLPSELQKRYRMPYADPAADLELAQAVTASIAASAPLVVFSYAERNKDGELRPSPLLPADAFWRDAILPPAAANSVPLEMMEEAAEVVPWPQDLVAGGTEVVKKQAACPFQAFANKRLHAKTLNGNEWGLSEAERGQRLHDVLCRIWNEKTGLLHTLEDLQSAIREERLDGILTQAIAESFRDFDSAEGWERAYIDSEQRRLRTRLNAWLTAEARRAPFAVIACEEDLNNVNVGELKLDLRVDRIDRLTDGSHILLDYKSGDVNTNDWRTPRPKEPQLPLYAIFGGVESLRGVLFAKIRAGIKDPILGSIANEDVPVLADNEENKKLAKTPFNAERRAEWSAGLRQLADDFLRGKAEVDPSEGAETCKYCGLQGLCRVAELRGALEDSETEEEGGDV